MDAVYRSRDVQTGAWVALKLMHAEGGSSSARSAPREARLLAVGEGHHAQRVHVLAHEETARIFALHWGRFTFALRWGVAPGETDASDRLLRVETLDGSVDLRALGPAWALWSAASDKDTEPDGVFLRLYERAGH